MEIRRSGPKHGIGDAGIDRTAGGFLVAYPIADDAPARELRLGFDTHGRLPETVVLLFDGGVEFVIHAMKARRQYFDLLP